MSSYRVFHTAKMICRHGRHPLQWVPSKLGTLIVYSVDFH